MAITVTNLGASTPAGIVAPDFESSTDAAAYANASWTPPSADNCIILCWVYNTKATTLGVAGTVTGNSLTWTNQASNGVDPGAQTHRLTLYAAISTGTATAGQTTVDFGGVTQSGIIMMFQQVEGVDLTGALAGVIIQQPTNTSSSANSLSANLSAASDAANRFFAGIGHGQPEGASAEAGWDELDDWGGSSPGRALMVMWDADSVADTSPVGSWTTAGAAVAISIEVVAAPETNQTFEEAVSLGRTIAVTDTNIITMEMATTLAAVKAVTDGNDISMEMAVTLAAIKAVALTNDLELNTSLTLSRVDTVSLVAQADMQAVLTMVKLAGITPESIATMNVALSMDRNVSVVLVGAFLVVVSKGYVQVLDFSANGLTTTSFKASSTSRLITTGYCIIDTARDCGSRVESRCKRT